MRKDQTETHAYIIQAEKFRDPLPLPNSFFYKPKRSKLYVNKIKYKPSPKYLTSKCGVQILFP